MKLSLIINTASLDPYVAARHNMYRKAQYGTRAALLRERVLPSAVGFDEVLVVGQFEGGDGYRYVEFKPRFRDRRDALWQREMGARVSTGDILVFAHDDHAMGDGFADTLRGMVDDESWDLLCPQRVHGITGDTLNNGEGNDYMGAHALVMRRWLWAAVPWNSLNTEYWDTSMTRLWREAGGHIVWTDQLQHIDVEATADER